MSFNNGDIVKLSDDEPCIVYRVVDNTVQMIECELLHKICEHIRIEVMGLVPLELLKLAKGHPNNAAAIDVKLNLLGQSN